MSPPPLLAAAVTEPFLLLSTQGPFIQAQGTASCSMGDESPRAGLSRPDGVFAAWSWDGGTLRARNDRYGMRPLYYFTGPGRIGISPSILTLLSLGAPVDLDESALAVFVRLGCFLGEDTPFRAIRALPPAAMLEWQTGCLRLASSRVMPRPQSLRREAAIDAYIDLFRTAIAKRLLPGDDFAVPLSGGRDSRHILLELCRASRPPRFCVTVRKFPPEPDEDVVVASDVARALELPHVILAQPKSQVAAELVKNRITNLCTDLHAWLLPLAEHLQGRARWVYDGIGGDVLSAGLFLSAERLTLLEEERFEDLAVGLFGHSEPLLSHLLAPEWTPRLGRDVAVARVASELRQHAEAANPLGSFYFWNRTRRGIGLSPYRILSQSVDVLSPYLDNDLFDFLASLPAALTLDHTLHTDTIRRAYPKYRDLRFEDKHAEPQQAARHTRRLARDLAAYALRAPATRSAPRLVHRPYVLTRALRSALDGDHVRLGWLAPALAVYLLQLPHEMEQARLRSLLAPDASPT